jgi:hypothetical protein
MLKPGEDPRNVLPGHQERGKIQFAYDLAQIAVAANLNYQTVRKAVSQEKLDPENLRSVASYIQRALARKSKTLKGGEMLSMLGPQRGKWWKNRWPKFDLYQCAQPECSHLLFAPGACAEHGGDRKPGVRFDSDGHICVLLRGSDYVPLHRLIAQTPKGMHTHHRDGNPWNNRFDNLESLPPDEHFSRHLGGILSAEVLPNQPARRPLRSEVGAFTKQQLQQLKDEAFNRGFKKGQGKG